MRKQPYQYSQRTMEIFNRDSMHITREQFERYEEVRESGVCNMFDLSAVIDYAGDMFTKDELIFIQSHYEKLCEQYGPEEID